ncbi:hypothetical protein SAMN04487977_103311 [Treponema bryantii]|uniref:Major outer membrane protein n=1 Tax=Treponema bryantii TaxID=163 RepID=A0A1H9EX22_9SPIR|nr:hypothetical protein [Treponema bryantii]SEQ30169.1 hypothetical protein SAMN04487977_103311 [Treponema bryantii]
MKKIVMGAAALLCAASMFAVDVSSTVQMEASIINDDANDKIEFFTLKNKNQKDDDALKFSASTDKAGASFQLWYDYDGTNGENIYTEVGGKDGDANKSMQVHGIRIRNVSLWFKPIDTLKVTVGDINLDSYKEQIFWWHGVYGEQPGTWGAFGGEYIAGNGLKLEFNPMDGLDITAAIFPGIDTAWTSTADKYGYKGYGLKAKYTYGAGSVAAVWADKGKDKDKIIGIGTDYNADGLYVFGNLNFRFNGDFDFTALTIDDFVKYSADALTIAAHLPVSVFKNAAGDMKVGLHATVKATYALDAASVYFLASTEPDGDKGWNFDDFKFAMTFKPGVTFNVGSASFDVAFRADINQGATNSEGKFNWSVPAVIKLGL